MGPATRLLVHPGCIVGPDMPKPRALDPLAGRTQLSAACRRVVTTVSWTRLIVDPSKGAAVSADRRGSLLAALSGRLLAYADEQTLDIAVPLTRMHGGSGLVVRGPRCAIEIRRLRAAGYTEPLIADVAAWARLDATTGDPMALPPAGGLFGVTLDGWAADLASTGADIVLTPSRFVRAGDWPTLRAVLTAAARTTRGVVLPLVAADAAMLDSANLTRLLATLAAESTGSPLAFAFAGIKEPLAALDRAAGLRKLLSAHPGSLLLAVDVLAGTDAAARGCAAAIGVTGGLRRHTRPGDTSGGFANGFAPGMFLPELWESRSPDTYADWYANSPAPTCTCCGGRAVDRLTNHPADKVQILAHNVRAWLDISTEINRRHPTAARAWLDTQRRRAFAAHVTLRPASGSVNADRLLRSLCELDDPQQRRTTPTGAWR